MDSILESIKAILGIPAGDDFFNNTLILHINSVFTILEQLGVGPVGGYSITGSTETWGDYNVSDPEKLRFVKSYMGLKVRQLFDPPLNSTVANALERQIAELEWRINVQVDPGAIEKTDDDSWYGRFENLDDDEF